MPKGTKAPPPQQSNLEEMWGKKKKRPASDAVPSEVKDDSDKQPGKFLSRNRPDLTKSVTESSKRKQSPVPDNSTLSYFTLCSSEILAEII